MHGFNIFKCLLMGIIQNSTLRLLLLYIKEIPGAPSVKYKTLYLHINIKRMI